MMLTPFDFLRHLSRIPLPLADTHLLVRPGVGAGRAAVRLHLRGDSLRHHHRLGRGPVGAVSHRARLAQAAG
jgi:hypothetical protein